MNCSAYINIYDTEAKTHTCITQVTVNVGNTQHANNYTIIARWHLYVTVTKFKQQLLIG